MEEPPIALEHRFVADATTAPAMARAAVAHNMRSRRVAVLLVGCQLVLATLLFSGFSTAYSLSVRLIASNVYALVATIAIAVFAAVAAYRLTLRQVRIRAYAGAVFETGFGDEGFVTRHPMGSARYPYSAVVSVATRDAFVLLRVAGSPVVRIYPRDLFPDDVLQRLATGTGTGPGPAGGGLAPARVKPWR